MKVVLRIAIILIITVLVSYFGLNLLAQYKIKSFIAKKTADKNLTYSDLRLHLWKGNIRFDSIWYHEDGQTIMANRIEAVDIKILDFLMGKNIAIQSLRINDPNFELKKRNKFDEIQENKHDAKVFNKRIIIDTLEISNLNLIMSEDSLTQLKLDNYLVNFQDFELYSLKFEADIPFRFSKGLIMGDAFVFNDGIREFKADSLEMNQNDLKVHRVVGTIAKPHDDHKMVSERKDSLFLQSLLMSNYKFDFQSRIPQLHSTKFALNGFEARFFKDPGSKRKNKESPVEKKKGLPVEFNLDTLEMNSLNIAYKSQSDTEESEWGRFAEYDVQITGLSSVGKSEDKILFDYQMFSIAGGQTSYIINDLQTIETDSLHLTHDEAHIFGIRILPRYTKQNYRFYIPHEKDLMNIEFMHLAIPEYHFSMEEGHLRSPKIALEGIEMNIYRDKRARDDLSRKALYGKMLRDLSVTVDIDTLAVSRANISYEEVQEKNGRTGRVSFKDMNFEIMALTNNQLDRKDFPETEFRAKGLFMGTSPISVNWKFKINDVNDQFSIIGRVDHIPPAAINSFLTPAFNVRALGKGIDNLSFNFYGNHSTAQGQFKLEYNDLKFDVLRKRTGDRNRLLSFAANLALPKERSEKNKAVEIPIIERDDTKSFWNFLWKCVSAGLVRTVI